MKNKTNFFKVILMIALISMSSLGFGQSLIGPIKTSIFTEVEIDSINTLLDGGEGSSAWKSVKKWTRYKTLQSHLETKGKTEIKRFLFSEEPSTKEIYAKCVFFMSMRHISWSSYLDTKKEKKEFDILLASQVCLFPQKYTDLRFFVQGVVKDSYRSYRKAEKVKNW